MTSTSQTCTGGRPPEHPTTVQLLVPLCMRLAMKPDSAREDQSHDDLTCRRSPTNAVLSRQERSWPCRGPLGPSPRSGSAHPGRSEQYHMDAQYAYCVRAASKIVQCIRPRAMRHEMITAFSALRAAPRTPHAARPLTRSCGAAWGARGPAARRHLRQLGRRASRPRACPRAVALKHGEGSRTKIRTRGDVCLSSLVCCMMSMVASSNKMMLLPLRFLLLGHGNV